MDYWESFNFAPILFNSSNTCSFIFCIGKYCTPVIVTLTDPMIPDASNILMIVWSGVLSFSKETTIAISLRALTGRILLLLMVIYCMTSFISDSSFLTVLGLLRFLPLLSLVSDYYSLGHYSLENSPVVICLLPCLPLS